VQYKSVKKYKDFVKYCYNSYFKTVLVVKDVL